MPPPARPDCWTALRAAMVREQLERRGLHDRLVLAALRAVPRHEFIPPEYRPESYADTPVPIGGGQTISQPWIVATMTALAAAGPGQRVLEIGTGCGYQTAVLAATGAAVWSVEIRPELAARARETLARLGVAGVEFRVGDGQAGWSEAAPFDAIVVTAAPEKIPPALRDQLAPGGRLVIPVGPAGEQRLLLLRRAGVDFTVADHGAVRFVPLVPGDSP